MEESGAKCWKRAILHENPLRPFPFLLCIVAAQSQPWSGGVAKEQFFEHPMAPLIVMKRPQIEIFVGCPKTIRMNTYLVVVVAITTSKKSHVFSRSIETLFGFVGSAPASTSSGCLSLLDEATAGSLGEADLESVIPHCHLLDVRESLCFSQPRLVELVWGYSSKIKFLSIKKVGRDRQ